MSQQGSQSSVRVTMKNQNVSQSPDVKIYFVGWRFMRQEMKKVKVDGEMVDQPTGRYISPIYTVLRKPIQAPKLGEFIVIPELYAEKLIEASRAWVPNVGFVEAFTRDGDLASAVARKFEQDGESIDVAKSLTVGNTLDALPTDMLERELENRKKLEAIKNEAKEPVGKTVKQEK
jgi:hypothetical protein